MLPHTSAGFGKPLMTELSISDVFRQVNARNPTFIMTSNFIRSEKYDILLDSPLVYAGDILRGGIMVTTTRIPHSISLELKGIMRYTCQLKKKKGYGIIRRQSSEGLISHSIEENLGSALGNGAPKPVHSIHNTPSDQRKIKLISVKTTLNLKPIEDNCETFYNKTFKIYEFSYAQNKLVNQMLFPFSINIPESVPGNINTTNFKEIGSELERQCVDEMTKDISIKYELSVQIKYSKVSVLENDSERITRDIIVIPKPVQGKEVIHQEQREAIHPTFPVLCKVFKLCTAPETIFAKLSCDVMTFNDPVKGVVSLEVIFSENLFEKRSFNAFRLQMNEVISDNHLQFESSNSIYEENHSIQPHYSLKVDISKFKDFHPDTQVKSFSIRHQLVGALRDITDPEQKNERVLFVFPVLLQVSPENNEEESFSDSQSESEYKSGCYITMPFAHIKL